MSTPTRTEYLEALGVAGCRMLAKAGKESEELFLQTKSVLEIAFAVVGGFSDHQAQKMVDMIADKAKP